MNRRKQKNNTSGYIGVVFDKRNNKYVAQYQLNGKMKYIGRYVTAEQASKAYQEKIKEHFKEYANMSN